MLFGFIIFIAGLVLIFISYLLAKLSSFFLTKGQNPKGAPPDRSKDGQAAPFGWTAFESARYAWVSVLLFGFGLMVAVYGLAIILGFIDFS